MSTILDVYLHGSVHLTNPGSEELFTGNPTQPRRPQRGPADYVKIRQIKYVSQPSPVAEHLLFVCVCCVMQHHNPLPGPGRKQEAERTGSK